MAPKAAPCQNWSATGSCRFGTSCRFSHSSAPVASATSGARAPAPAATPTAAKTAVAVSAPASAWGPARAMPTVSTAASAPRAAVVSSASPTTATISSALASLPASSLGVALQSLELSEPQRASSSPTSSSLVRSAEPPARKAPGVKGRALRLVTNFFPVQLANHNVVYMYSADFPDEISPQDFAARKAYFQRFVGDVKTAFAFFLFDNTVVLTLAPAASGANRLEFDHADGAHLTLTLVKTISSTAAGGVPTQEEMTVLNKLFKSLLRSLNVLNFGTSYYFKDKKPLKDELAVFSGFNCSLGSYLTHGLSSASPSPSSGCLLNLELAHRVVQTKSVRQQMQEIESRVRAQPANAKLAPNVIRERVATAINDELRGCFVCTTYQRQVYRVDFVDMQLTVDSTFTRGDQQVSYRQYMKQRYNIDLQAKASPDLLINIPRRAATADEETCKLVPELCFVTGVNERLKSDTRLMQALASYTRMAADKRLGKTVSLAKQLHASQLQMLTKIPLSLSADPACVEARVLGPFVLSSSTSRLEVSSSKTNFANEARRFGFYPPPSSASSSGGGSKRIVLRSWLYMSAARFSHWTADIVAELQRTASSRGVDLPAPRIISVEAAAGGQREPMVSDWSTALTRGVAAAGGKPQFIFFLVPKDESNVYSFVKGITIEKEGIVTQATTDATMGNQKIYRPALSNMFVQIMCKLGYRPWLVDFTPFLPVPSLLRAPASAATGSPALSGLMMVGMDVQHEAAVPGAYMLSESTRHERSTVGFVASFDASHSAFHTYLSYQPRRSECILKAQELMSMSLLAYKKKNGVFPAAILIFRDGVGDSQLKPFVEREIDEYEQAFRALSICPKLSVLVVQKRLSVRLFEECAAARSPSSVCHNPHCRGQGETHHSVTPFSVVDKGIVSPLFNDFFLSPCAAPNGATSRPTRFIIVKDELAMSMDNLESLAAAMCCAYANWPGAIRSPHVTMLAHKAAFLFGKYLASTAIGAQDKIHPDLRDKTFYL